MSRGGKREGAGRKPGVKLPSTISKEMAREALREIVTAHMAEMTQAQIAHAKGISHFMLRDPKSGKFERLTDADQIAAALNADGAEEGSTYYIWAKDPSVQAYTDLMNRALDKPKEQEQVINLKGSVEIVERLQAARKRLEQRK